MKTGKTKPILLATLTVVAATALLLVLQGRRIEEGRCKLVRKKTDPSTDLMRLTYQVLQPRSDKPDNIRDLPAGFDRPCYYLIESAGRQIPLVLNLAHEPSLCVDRGGDGVLSKERRFAAKHVLPSKRSGGSWLFGPISLFHKEDPGKADDSFYVMMSGDLSAACPLVLYPAFYKTGRLSLEGRTYRVAMVDVDHDGRFSSALSLPIGVAWRTPGCDVFAIDLNHDRKFEFTRYGPSEVMPLGRMVSVADSYYTIDIAADGATLVLSKAEPHFGTLAVEPNDTSACLKLWSDAADQYLTLGRHWQLPAGRYKAVNAWIRKGDSVRNEWTFMAKVSESTVYGYADLGPLNFFEIRPGETTTIRVGPPFAVKAIVEPAGQRDFVINAALVDSAGVEYTMDFRRGNRPPQKHAFKIIDEQKNVLTAGAFEYG
jgi:hypothetical protein